MLKALFHWLDLHPSSYWALVAAPTLLLVAWAITPAWRENRGRPPRPDRSLWSSLVLFLFLLAWRWPYLLAAHGLNPDESHHVAGTLALAADPVFFRSVDGSTSGPLNFYVPLLVGRVLGTIDYFTVRLAGLLLVWGTLVACHRLLIATAGAPAARLALLPAAMLFATTTDWDFLHYSSEHVPIFLLGVAAWLLVRSASSARPEWWLAAGGFLLGASPWAKLQIGPLSAVVAVCALWHIARTADPVRTRWRRAGVLALSTLLPSVLALGLLGLTRGFDIFVQRYVLQNFIYVEEGATWFETLRMLWTFARFNGSFPAFLVAPAALIGLALIVLAVRRQWPGRAFLAGAILTTVALICTMVPGRGFLHYFLLLIVPLALWGGAALHEVRRRLRSPRARLVLSASVLVAGGIWPLGVRLAQPEPFMFGEFAEHWRHPRSDVANLVHHLAGPGDRLSVWGYAPEIYAESGVPQSTRDSYTYWAMEPTPGRDGYRATYLDDLRRSRPALFVDAVGPGAFFYRDRRQHGHESFAGLAAYVGENYRLVTDLGRARVYARPDVLNRRDLTEETLRQLTLHREWQSRQNIPPPATITPPQLFWHQLGLRSVLMVLAPTKLEWVLDGTEREFRFEHGLDPIVFTEGDTDGVEFIVELVRVDGAPQRLFSELLNPHHRAHRRHRRARVTLPPSPPGSRLVLRTGPGPAENYEWDRAYVAQVRFRRAGGF